MRNAEFMDPTRAVAIIQTPSGVYKEKKACDSLSTLYVYSSNSESSQEKKMRRPIGFIDHRKANELYRQNKVWVWVSRHAVSSTNMRTLIAWYYDGYKIMCSPIRTT